MDKGPIFIAGVERSGTSLMYALLASHPSIAMTRRTNLWTYFYEQYGDLKDDANLERCIDMMMRYQRLVKLRLDPDRLSSDFKRGDRTYARLFALAEEQYAERLGKSRWGDKSLNTERYAAPIVAAYPGVRIIHMIRDPRDRYASVRTRWQGRLAGVGGATAEWLTSARLAKQNSDLYSHCYRTVRYEDLARHPSDTLREVCAFIDEPFTDEMLTMQGDTKFRDQGSNSSYGARGAGTITATSVGKFRTVLSDRQVAFIQYAARREMADFGYGVEPIGLDIAERVRYLAADLPLEFARLMGWRTRYKIRNRTGRPLPAYRIVPRDDEA